MTATIKDVAQRAGVSKAAVSYVLNGREAAMRIPEETRDRILGAVRELGYHPNAVARSLANKGAHTIAVVMQYPEIFAGWSGFTNELMHGVTDAAVRLGYDVMLHTRKTVEWGDSAVGPMRAEVARLTDGRVDGALLLRDMEDPLIAELARKRFPAVLMFTHSNDPGQWYVDADNFSGGCDATKHLLSLGHRRVLHISGPGRSGAGRERLQGYETAMAEAGLSTDVVSVAEPGWELALAMPLLRKAGGPTAIFAWSDDAAVRMMHLLQQEGFRVPGDVAVVGFDSTTVCDHTNPPLTSMRQPVYSMAAQALELLASKLQGSKVEQVQVRVKPKLNVRSSCGGAAVVHTLASAVVAV